MVVVGVAVVAVRAVGVVIGDWRLPRWLGGRRRSATAPMLAPASATVDISGRPSIFAVARDSDPSGVSGVGIVAWGAMYPDGKAVLRWTGETTGVQQVCVFDSIYDIETVHGHDGASRVVFFPESRVDRDGFALDMTVGLTS